MRGRKTNIDNEADVTCIKQDLTLIVVLVRSHKKMVVPGTRPRPSSADADHPALVDLEPLIVE